MFRGASLYFGPTPSILLSTLLNFGLLTLRIVGNDGRSMPERQYSSSDFVFPLYQTSRKDFTVLMNIHENGLCRFRTDMSIILQVFHIRRSKGPTVPNVSMGSPLPCILWSGTPGILWSTSLNFGLRKSEMREPGGLQCQVP